jgi:hypothetical protein
MKTLYIDESGTPELSSQDKHVILCGVLIDESQESNFNFLMERVKRKYKLDLFTHIHSIAIFEDSSERSYLGQTKKRKKRDLRRKFQEEVWALIKDYELQYYVVTVRKDMVKKSLGLHKRPDKGSSWIGNKGNLYATLDRQLPMDVATNVIYRWALNKCAPDEKLKVVFEARSGDMFTVRNYVHISSGDTVFKNAHMASFSRAFKERVVSIGFANKHVRSVGLELADIISYTCNICFLQVKKSEKQIPDSLKRSVLFKAIHKTLNRKHYRELTQQVITSHIPGLASRTRRISRHYTSILSESRNGGSPVKYNIT